MTELKLALAGVITELQKNRTEIKRQKALDTTLADKITTNLNALTALQTKLNEISSGGLVIPHYATTQARDAAIPHPVEGQTCYVGVSGAWYLNTYELKDGALKWVEGHFSEHNTAADDTTWKQTKQDKLSAEQLAILNGVVFTQAEKDIIATLNQNYATKNDVLVDDTALNNLKLDVI